MTFNIKGATIRILGGAGVFELDKLFIPPPVFNILFISSSVSASNQAKYLLETRFRLSIDIIGL